MKIGVPKEIKTNENRVALVPAGVEALVAKGHQVFIENTAGEGSGFENEAFEQAGATILPDADAVWRALSRQSDLPAYIGTAAPINAGDSAVVVGGAGAPRRIDAPIG